MTFTTLLLIGVGLSMDAFAVSVCKGLQMKKINYYYTFIIALFFGGFQALMPLLGWAAGKQFEKYITSFDHWIAFVLLLFIGGKMFIGSLKKDKDETGETCCSYSLNIKELFVLAVATSIDALAVGITFAFLSTSIVYSITVIGITTFVLSIAGVAIGNRFGIKYKDKAETFGGVILVLIGVKIVLEHMGVL